MKNMKISLDELLILIPKKEDGKITAKSLSEMTQTSESYIRRRINEARTIGISICSTRFGYYFSDEYDDVAATIRFLTHRINTQLRAIEGLTKIYTEGENERTRCNRDSL